MAVGNACLPKYIALLLSLLLLTACKNDPLDGRNDPKDDSWNMTFEGPAYMQGWVELRAVEDINGRLMSWQGGGGIGGDEPGLDKEYARGWGSVGGSIFPMTGADLPKRIFVRWQSIVEQKTYKGWVEIPEYAREIMRGSTARRCPDWPDHPANFMASAVVGLTPGGAIRAWVRDNCLNNHLIARAQAEIEPLGPSQGLNQGRYAYPISEPSKRYIERYGIPYGSW